MLSIPHPSADQEIVAGANTKPYLIAANGNRTALEFLVMWHEYLHEIDDLIDNKVTDPQQWIRAFANANLVYSHDFYTAYARDLRLIVMIATNAYADSVAWESVGVEWQRQWADISRHAGLEMVFAVAVICGGYDKMRAISAPLKEFAHKCHHDEEGKPI